MIERLLNQNMMKNMCRDIKKRLLFEKASERKDD